MEYSYGWFGGMASRKCGTAVWSCYDSDYSWFGVTDDYGNIVAVSSFTNNRGY